LNTDYYKQLLLEKEQELLTRLKEAGEIARKPGDEPVSDAGDASLENERKEEQFRDADADWRVLIQVREALERIQNGTYGRCLVDGEPIDEKRLEAIPWTPYCLKHQQLIEGARLQRTPTL
jgi:DnaK suppressor protein